jgi:glutamine amidotransferase
MIKEIDLVDIGGGNIGSVKRCLNRLNVQYRMIGSDNPPDGSRPLLLPGVGAFGPVMSHLQKNNLDKAIKVLAQKGTPVLGVCIGMQILFDSSEEAVDSVGLGLIAGKVMRFRSGKVPQIGWNLVTPVNNGWESGYAYFVNSFYGKPENSEDILLKADYYDPFCAAVRKNNITGFQFHPEKSGQFGETLLRRWLSDLS